MSPDSPTFRPITHDALEELAALVSDAFAGYRSFAPQEWQPPPASAHVHGLRRWVDDRDFWGELASDEHTVVGHATFIPAPRHTYRGAQDAALAHLGQLFVRPPYWGSGVAAALLEHALAAATSRGYAAMRLFVPVGQARARRFYARHGFSGAGEPFDPALGIPVLEYRRSL
jgi:GNAT superfamily N-acetyltransferase